MRQLKNIVVGIDFSEYSQVALKQAIDIAKWRHSNLTAVHVVDYLVLEDLASATGVSKSKLQQDLEKDSKKELQKVIDKAGYSNVSLEIAFGTPSKEIFKLVDSQKADLLVLGAKGQTCKNEGAGSLATRAVRKANTKVMLVRKEHVEKFTKIVTLFDFSETSVKAVEQGCQVAVQDKAKLHIAHFFTAPWQILHYRAPTSQDPEYKKQYINGLEAEMDSSLEEIDPLLSQVESEKHLVKSLNLKYEVIEFIKQQQADLVVLGTRGRRGLNIFLMGTMAEYVVAHSPCSVLTVKPKGFSS